MSVAELKAYMDKMAKEAMLKGNAVKDTVIQTGQKHVKEDVYDKYPNPRMYQRSGGLMEDWDYKETSDGIAIYSNRIDKETGKNIGYTIETGQGYDYDFEYSGVPRPFIEETRKELASDKRILADALKRDLKNIGIKTN